VTHQAQRPDGRTVHRPDGISGLDVLTGQSREHPTYAGGRQLF
jgi:hypothetical protein